MMTVMRQIWNDNPVRQLFASIFALFLGIAGTSIGMSWLNNSPAVTIRRDGAQAVKVSGIEVSVEADGTRTKAACPNAYAVRRMVRYWPDGSIKDVAFMRETQVASLDVGRRKYTLHLHLYTALEGSDWFYTAEIHDECGVFSNFLQRKPSITTPAPVTFVSNLPTDGASVTFQSHP